MKQISNGNDCNIEKFFNKTKEEKIEEEFNEYWEGLLAVAIQLKDWESCHKLTQEKNLQRNSYRAGSICHLGMIEDLEEVNKKLREQNDRLINLLNPTDKINVDNSDK